MSLGSSGKYTDRPTITYAPITGSQFNKSFMTPIPPGAILFLMVLFSLIETGGKEGLPLVTIPAG